MNGWQYFGLISMILIAPGVTPLWNFVLGGSSLCLMIFFMMRE